MGRKLKNQLGKMTILNRKKIFKSSRYEPRENHATKASHSSLKGQGLINLSLESNAFNVRFKFHTLQLDTNSSIV